MSILDSRDLEERLVELTGLASDDEEAGEEFDQQEELDSLTELKESTENEGWEYGIMFIPKHEFTDYAEELAEDCYELQTTWPYNHIDWDEAAKELLYDYSEVDYEGTTYYYTEAW